MTWDNFWENKGSRMEWSKKDVLKSRVSNQILKQIFRFKKISSLNGLNLLEIGCGMGLTSLFFAKNGAHVTLLDKSDSLKKLIKSYYGDIPYNFIQKDIFNYSPKILFDITTSFGLCEHFVGKEREKILEMHIELLNEGGVAVISVPHKYGVFYRINKSVMELLNLWEFGTEVPFSKKELINFAKMNKLDYKLLSVGFWPSFYDLFFRKPLKFMGINIQRRFDNTESIFDRHLGSGLILIIHKTLKK